MRARDVSVSRRGRTVLSRVDLDIAAGEIVTLIGPNGAGKSTLVKVLLGLIAAETGEVWRVAGGEAGGEDAVEIARGGVRDADTCALLERLDDGSEGRELLAIPAPQDLDLAGELGRRRGACDAEEGQADERDREPRHEAPAADPTRPRRARGGIPGRRSNRTLSHGQPCMR